MALKSMRLHDLKIGDKVYVVYLGKPQTIGTVKKVTKTQIVLEGGSRWVRETGKRYGQTSRWNNNRYIEPLSDEHLEFIERRNLSRKVVKKMEDISNYMRGMSVNSIHYRSDDKMTLEELRSVVGKIDEIQKIIGMLEDKNEG